VIPRVPTLPPDMTANAPRSVPDPDRWVAYTDGACAPSNPGPAAWGAVILGPNGRAAEHARGFIGHGTNQIAEITAAIEGLSRVPEGASVELVSDSQYVLKGLSEWRAGWERRNWRNSKNEPVANLALWQRLFAVADARRVGVRWVRGHNGDPYNETADRLANEALRDPR
jgi:ribonuclease HI